jgi:CheY-like chemotaxis protein
MDVREALKGSLRPGHSGSQEYPVSEGKVDDTTPCFEMAARPPARGKSDDPLNQPLGSPRCRVLVIDDEESIRGLVKEKLTREGREVLLASNGQEGLKLFYRERPDITILDLKMPGMNGLEVLRRIKAFDRRAVVMVFTGCQTEDAIKEAYELGVTDFLQKGQSLTIAWDGRRRQE